MALAGLVSVMSHSVLDCFWLFRIQSGRSITRGGCHVQRRELGAFGMLQKTSDITNKNKDIHEHKPFDLQDF